MAGNIYLYLDGIPGESYAQGFLNWIDVADFSIGVTMEIDQNARIGSGGGTSGAADPQDLECSMKLSTATPVLMQCCAVGAIIPRAKLIQCNVVNEERLPVSEYGFGDSIISNISLSGSGGGIPDQSLSINYGSIKWKYHYYKHDDPSKVVTPAIERGWSLITNNPEGADPNTESAMRDIEKGRTYEELFEAQKDQIEFNSQSPVTIEQKSVKAWEEEYC